MSERFNEVRLYYYCPGDDEESYWLTFNVTIPEALDEYVRRDIFGGTDVSRIEGTHYHIEGGWRVAEIKHFELKGNTEC